MQIRVYRQNLWKLTYLSLAGGLTLFFVMALVLQLHNLYAYPEQQNRDVEIISFSSGIAVGLITWLILWLVLKKQTVAIDSNGFENTTSRPFIQAQKQRFEWREVTATSIINKTYTGESGESQKQTFSVSVKGESIELIERGKYFKRGLIDVMNTANAQTPHLPYIWKECSKIDNRKVFSQIETYCKIKRD